MKKRFYFFAVGLFLSIASEASLINLITVTGAQFNSLTQQTSTNPNVPSAIVGDLRLADLNGANATFTYQDFANTPTSHLLGGPAFGGQQIRISNNSGVAWTDFHFELDPNSVATFDILSALIIAPAGSTALTITASSVDLVFSNPIASGQMFSLSGLGLDIPDLGGPGFGHFSMNMRPTFMPEPSSIALVILAGLLLHFVSWVSIARTEST